MRKHIAGVLVASLLIGSAPGWAEDGNATGSVEVAQRQQLRDSIERAVDGPVSSPALTAAERADLEARRAILTTDPVARGAGGMLITLIGIAASIALTVYLLKKTEDSVPPPTMARQ